MTIIGASAGSAPSTRSVHDSESIWIVDTGIIIDKKSVKTSEILNSNLLKKLKLINKRSSKLKILGSGEIKDKINIEADLASKSAINKLEKIGGSIQIKK